MPPVRLFVGNLPYQATEDDLRTHFAQVGNPTQIVRPLDRETGRARGFAFVEYAERKGLGDAAAQLDWLQEKADAVTAEDVEAFLKENRKGEYQ